MTKGQQQIVDFLSDGEVHNGREFYANFMPKFSTRISEMNKISQAVIGEDIIDIQLTGTKYRNYQLKVK